MTKPYNPKEIEGKWYSYWIDNKFFHSEPDEREPYCIVIPPPNITGALHMGHALNNCIQDVLIRFHRMQNYNACWIPGTDHAGIATQSVVEKKLYQEEGKTRHDIGRKALLERIWKWREQYGNRIIEQLKKLGCSCDWDRTCFTMDKNLSRAVRHVFLQLFKDGLIYRGKRLINWCPGCRTALSNDELNYKQVKANLWEIKYPIKDSSEFITVATTRPETMLGDTAVAVNSKDKRYTHLVGKTCILPLLNREIPIIADDILADPEKGTGAVKVTPAHDPNDYACGLRNNLPMINILNEDGTLNENAGKYKGLDILTARKKVLEDLKEQNLLGKIYNIEHSVAHCYRSDDVVEPFLSDQWFVKMEPLVKLARKAVIEGEVKFFPEKRKDDYLRWLDTTPDWCISRQIWWGHRIPIWYCRDCNPEIEVNKEGEPVSIPSEVEPILPNTDDPDDKPTQCPKCKGKNLVQDPDVLDTWFSSQLWPLSTLGWPDETKDLNYYYPTNVLVTARDIIALWVARMVMMGMKFRGKKPFSHVFIHGTIQDEHGDIMSKSRGNGFDPVKIIEGGTDHIKAKQPLGNIPAERTEHYPIYGCDALRYGLMSMTSGQGQDIRIAVKREIREDKSYDVSIPLFEEGKRFCNKIWQACHGVIFKHCEKIEILEEESPYLEDKWLSNKLNSLIKTSTKALKEYKIGEMCNLLYHFFWDDLCSWYLEIIKPRLWNKDENNISKKHAQSMLVKAISVFLRLLHPVMPFITEELWQDLRKLEIKNYELDKACIISKWPTENEFKTYENIDKIIEKSREIVYGINNIRAEYNIQPNKKVNLVIVTSEDSNILNGFKELLEGVKRLAKVKEFKLEQKIEKPEQTAVKVIEDITIYIPLKGLLDFEKEKKRLKKEIEKIEKIVEKLNKKLNNENYIKKAPKEIIERDKKRLKENKEHLEKLKKELESYK